MSIQKFNIRVYGLLIKNNQVLITSEHRAGIQMLKFPGGGLEKGEGIEDCLIREFDEELGISINLKGLYYINEFFQESVFNNSDQLLSIYYTVKTKELDNIPVVDLPIKLEPDEQVFTWIDLGDLKNYDFNFPIDKIVAEKLYDQRKN